jgi:GNAT superfamily N-acetyltransferase
MNCPNNDSSPADARNFSWRSTPLPEDAEKIKKLVQSSGFFSPAEVSIAVELVEERLGRGIQSGYFFLFADKGKTLIGYTCYGPIPGTRSSYDLYWIAVDQRFRGHGAGKQLLLKTEELIRQMGGTRIYAETSSRPQYASTRAFYEHTGYKQAAFLRDFYSPGDGKVIFVKEKEGA